MLRARILVTIVLPLLLCCSCCHMASATTGLNFKCENSNAAKATTSDTSTSRRSSSSSSSSVRSLYQVRGGSDDEAVETAATANGTVEDDSSVLTKNETTTELDTSTTSSSTATATATASSSSSTQLRLEGKEAHDKGDFTMAAELFQQAADSLQKAQGEDAVISEEYATCRLHQALCHLKSENYESCLQACSDILRDNDTDTATDTAKVALTAPAVRARAYHRRAKAKLALGDPSGALQDARSAAFLGDRKAVALYGRLMRESSSSPFSSDPTSATGNILSPLSSSSSPSPNASLLESLLNKSSSSSNGGMPDFSPASLLLGNGSNGILGALGSGGAGGSSGLAKSVMKSLAKRLEDKDTQVSISNYLQNTNKAQFQQLASMAGITHAIQDSHLDRLVSLCHRVTPKRIRGTVKTTKRAAYGIQVIRRIVKIMNKYKSVLVALALLQWTKSACSRPIPIDRSAVKRATKLALKEGMKANK